MKRSRVILFFLVLLHMLPAAPAAAKRPNILFIFTDDHANHAIGAYGSTINKTPQLDRLAAQGMLFRNSFVTNSLCAPSRAAILTGKYSHLNGLLTNRDTFDGSQVTFPKLLTEAGYSTALIGKWHLKSQPTGFEHYEILYGQGSYYNPRMNRNGHEVKHVGYTTDLITDLTLQWLEEGRDKTKPFMLMTQHKAPHGRWEPALRHLKMYDNEDIPEPATLFYDFSGRGPASKLHKMGIADEMNEYRLMIQYSSQFTPEQFEIFDGFFKPRNQPYIEGDFSGKERTRWHYQRFIKNYLRCIAAVDENTGRLLDYLDRTGLAKNTMVVYSSDQGFYLGDYGWFDKRWMYELSLRTPLIVRWPGIIQPGSSSSELVLNLDLPQTFLEVAGLQPPSSMQGRSLVPILKGRAPDDWRSSIYYHYYEGGGHGVPKHEGVRTQSHKLIHFYTLNEWELYDLEKDPGEMQNVINARAYAEVLEDLRLELAELRRIYALPPNQD
jgi:arylsulfatase A-like enzyme